MGPVSRINKDLLSGNSEGLELMGKTLKRITIVIVIILALVLLVPIPISYYDGGTVEYRAVLYSVINYHAINGDGYDTGIGIKVLGMTIYENKTFTPAALNMLL